MVVQVQVEAREVQRNRVVGGQRDVRVARGQRADRNAAGQCGVVALAGVQHAHGQREARLLDGRVAAEPHQQLVLVADKVRGLDAAAVDVRGTGVVLVLVERRIGLAVLAAAEDGAAVQALGQIELILFVVATRDPRGDNRCFFFVEKLFAM